MSISVIHSYIPGILNIGDVLYFPSHVLVSTNMHHVIHLVPVAPGTNDNYLLFLTIDMITNMYTVEDIPSLEKFILSYILVGY